MSATARPLPQPHLLSWAIDQYQGRRKRMVVVSLVVAFAALVYFALGGRQSPQLPISSITDQEISDFISELRRNDGNRAGTGQVQVDYQGHTSTRDTNDNARQRFFKSVDQSLFSDGTYARLLRLYDNYVFETGVTEVETQQERTEIREFIDAIMDTQPIRMLFQLLKRKGHPFAQSESIFRQWILQLWFAPYSRARGSPDSSGFEHVFLGEAKNGEISGMHNWVRLYYLENQRSNNSWKFDYKGFLVKRFDIFGALKYSYGQYMKRSGSFFIGTSPEFDMAVYTFCFLHRRGRDTCNFEFDGCPISVTSFDLIQQGRIHIGSMYPSAGRMTEECRRLNS